MFPTKFVLILTLWLSLSNFAFKSSGDDVTTQSPTTECLNCSKCEYPCQQQPSPPLTYNTPPLTYNTPPLQLPPPPSPISSGYSIYGAPPPPQEKDHTKCPPAAGVQCCTPPAAPYIFSPPNPYTPVPYGAASSMLLPVLLPLMILFSSFIFLF